MRASSRRRAPARGCRGDSISRRLEPAPLAAAAVHEAAACGDRRPPVQAAGALEGRVGQRLVHTWHEAIPPRPRELLLNLFDLTLVGADGPSLQSSPAVSSPLERQSSREAMKREAASAVGDDADDEDDDDDDDEAARPFLLDGRGTATPWRTLGGLAMRAAMDGSGSGKAGDGDAPPAAEMMRKAHAELKAARSQRLGVVRFVEEATSPDVRARKPGFGRHPTAPSSVFGAAVDAASAPGAFARRRPPRAPPPSRRRRRCTCTALLAAPRPPPRRRRRGRGRRRERRQRRRRRGVGRARRAACVRRRQPPAAAAGGGLRIALRRRWRAAVEAASPSNRRPKLTKSMPLLPSADVDDGIQVLPSTDDRSCSPSIRCCPAGWMATARRRRRRRGRRSAAARSRRAGDPEALKAGAAAARPAIGRSPRHARRRARRRRQCAAARAEGPRCLPGRVGRGSPSRTELNYLRVRAPSLPPHPSSRSCTTRPQTPSASRARRRSGRSL